MVFWNKKKTNRQVTKYRVRVDGWLYLTNDSTLSWDLKDAAEFRTLKEAYEVEIPHVDVVYIENKNGKVNYIHIEEVREWL